MSKMDSDNESMVQGIRQLLGKEAYPDPTPVPEKCEHETDGYIYNREAYDSGYAAYIILRCEKCGEYYNVYKDGFTV